MRWSAVTLVVVVVACSGKSQPHARSSRIALPSIDQTPRSKDDPIVAKVDGHPIYGSCVATQAAAHHADAKHALDECIGFELLAHAALARGVEQDPDVGDAYRRALVSRFVDVEFRDHYATFDDLPQELRDAAYEKFKWRLHRPEYRYAVYVRATLGDKATPADDDAAHALIQAVYDRLKDRRDLFADDLYEAADAVAGAKQIDKSAQPYGTGLDGPGERSFTTPLFSIPDIGMVAPPARTKWGWDLILYVGKLPALETTPDELRAWLFPELRHAWFEQWTEDLAKAENANIVVDEDRLAALAEPEERAK
ncbi:MAG TPA: hypothetical protein VL463_06725 [Kofleriaceae bacterium]|nr:hypothetical protein [Kofleriaceae bacterium]